MAFSEQNKKEIKLELWVVTAEVGHPFKFHFLQSFMLIEAQRPKSEFPHCLGEMMSKQFKYFSNDFL